MKMKAKRTGMKIKENKGQWHKDINRVHTYSNRTWVIVFTDCQGHYDSNTGICVKADIEVKIMPTKNAVLKKGLAAFVGKGKRANLVMRNVAL